MLCCKRSENNGCLSFILSFIEIQKQRTSDWSSVLLKLKNKERLITMDAHPGNRPRKYKWIHRIPLHLYSVNILTVIYKLQWATALIRTKPNKRFFVFYYWCFDVIFWVVGVGSLLEWAGSNFTGSNLLISQTLYKTGLKMIV